MVYVTGDCHAEWSKLSSENFPEQREMTRDDYVIVCGDFGLWHNTREERWWLNWLCERNFTVLFVDGNHENFDRLYKDFKVVDFHGGKAHQITYNIYHLMRGYVFDLCGKKFFTFGGASSHDIDDGILDRRHFSTDKEFVAECNLWAKQNKMFRINHISWWEQEMPSDEEMEFGLSTLEKNGNKVDYIISHCCPQEIASTFSNGVYKPDKLTSYFNEVANKVEFTKWFFGHYHRDQELFGKYVMLYHDIIRII